jgi:hypothetical protein
MQWRPRPQRLPSATLPVSIQTAEPVVQEKVPVVQGFPVGQLPPWSQGRHWPPRQKFLLRLEPHGVPSMAFPFSLHTGVPLAQVVVPVRHGAGSHAILSTQVAHAPSLQTLPAPQSLLVPLGALPVTMHCEVPVAQELVPILQGVAVGHTTPSLQDTQLPLLQTRSAPHELPLATFLVESMHSAVPAEHERVPV